MIYYYLLYEFFNQICKNYPTTDNREVAKKVCNSEKNNIYTFLCIGNQPY
jgi:hypothetical protein